MQTLAKRLLAKALMLPKSVRGELVDAIQDSLEPRDFDLSDDDISDVSRWCDELIEEADKKGLQRRRRHDRDVPEIWRSRYYFRQGYHLRTKGGSRHLHWQGGDPHHRNAACPHCDTALHLLWDIDCGDRRFRKESPEVFGRLKRLPLYYCLRCARMIAYRCTRNRLEVFKLDGDDSGESPFSDYPDTFPRRPLAFRPIPAEIENLLLIYREFDDDWLRARHRKMLAEYFHFDGPPRYVDQTIRRSQFGGLPILQQRDPELLCPYGNCPTHTWGHPIARNQRYYMMEVLAVIGQDAGFEMNTTCAQVVFHICWGCQTIRAQYQID